MRDTTRFNLWAVLVAMTLVCCVVAGLALWLRLGNDGANKASCCGLYVHPIAGACLAYEEDHGTLPPAYIADESGKAMHSWRVLLLPYLGYDELYSLYDFSEAWNGPNNSRLAEMMPPVYRCPGYRGSHRYTTSYVAVVGPETAWRGDKGVPLGEVTDYGSETVLIVEVADSDINWMEPRDMSFEQALAGVNVDMRHGISSYHRGGAFCGFLYGSAFLRDGTPPETLKALLTISGGEPHQDLDEGF
jgi:hypothetical protein